MSNKKQIFISSIIFILIAASCSSGRQTSPAVEIPADGQTQIADSSPTFENTNQNGEQTSAADPPSATVADSVADYSYPVVDTDQTYCFSDSDVIPCGDSYNGQDAQYAGLQPAYQNNGDGTVTDLNTGLMWIADPGEKMSYAEAMQKLESFSYAGYDDWRLPTIKELYSLALFSGVDASMASSGSAEGLKPFMNTDYFVFLYGDESGGSRVIDAQWMSSTVYNSTVMDGQSCFFGFNFADGRIKCYPIRVGGSSGGYFAMLVRSDNGYGVNSYVNNGNGTIADQATGLTWTQSDNGNGVLWDEALSYCEALNMGGMDDWRLPHIKELQSIVDYTRSPDTTESPAIHPLFNLTPITNELDQTDWGFYWSSTTLISYPNRVSDATYISFGRALGYMEQFGGWVDVHGAGAQRSDEKSGVSPDHQLGGGPQGDARRSDNYVLCVTDGVAEPDNGTDPSTLTLANGGNALQPGTLQEPSQSGAQTPTQGSDQ
jgi:hypothetical protein